MTSNSEPYCFTQQYNTSPFYIVVHFTFYPLYIIINWSIHLSGSTENCLAGMCSKELNNSSPSLSNQNTNEAVFLSDKNPGNSNVLSSPNEPCFSNTPTSGYFPEYLGNDLSVGSGTNQCLDTTYRAENNCPVSSHNNGSQTPTVETTCSDNVQHPDYHLFPQRCCSNEEVSCENNQFVHSVQPTSNILKSDNGQACTCYNQGQCFYDLTSKITYPDKFYNKTFPTSQPENVSHCRGEGQDNKLTYEQSGCIQPSHATEKWEFEDFQNEHLWSSDHKYLPNHLNGYNAKSEKCYKGYPFNCSPTQSREYSNGSCCHSKNFTDQRPTYGGNTFAGNEPLYIPENSYSFLNNGKYDCNKHFDYPEKVQYKNLPPSCCSVYSQNTTQLCSSSGNTTHSVHDLEHVYNKDLYGNREQNCEICRRPNISNIDQMTSDKLRKNMKSLSCETCQTNINTNKQNFKTYSCPVIGPNRNYQNPPELQYNKAYLSNPESTKRSGNPWVFCYRGEYFYNEPILQAEGPTYGVLSNGSYFYNPNVFSPRENQISYCQEPEHLNNVEYIVNQNILNSTMNVNASAYVQPEHCLPAYFKPDRNMQKGGKRKKTLYNPTITNNHRSYAQGNVTEYPRDYKNNRTNLTWNVQHSNRFRY